MRNLAFAVIGLLVFVASTACEPALLTPIEGENATTNNATTNNANMTNPYEGDMEAAVDGENLYTSTACNSCHGPMGEGTASFPGLEGTAMLSDAEVFDSIENGRPGTAMGPFGEANNGPFSDDDIWKVVTFIRTLEE